MKNIFSCIGQVFSGKISYKADLLGHPMTTCQNSYEADLLSRPCHLNSKSIKWPPLVITIEQNPKAGPCHLAVTSSQWPPTHNNIYRAGPQSRSLPLQVSVLYYCTVHKNNTKYNHLKFLLNFLYHRVVICSLIPSACLKFI